jgi:uncharacterized membrane protein YvbJ
MTKQEQKQEQKMTEQEQKNYERNWILIPSIIFFIFVLIIFAIFTNKPAETSQFQFI